LTAILFLFCPVGKNRFTALALAGALMLVAGLDEWTQPCCGCTAEWADWLADVGGIVLGLIMTQLNPALFPTR
jgi:hypothetical protein